ncbi:MAG: 23S rRNA (guanosine(2251)-2'-O)-methyltransferase RlmB [Tenacibaculum sp.]
MEDKTIIFGIRAIIEAVESGFSISKIYLQKGLRGSLYYQLEKIAKKDKIATVVVPIEKLNTLSKHSNHQGAVAKVSPIEFYKLDNLVQSAFKNDKKPLFLLLDQVSDVRNFGAIIRTAECTGVSGIIIQQGGSAPVNAQTIKTSAGAAFKMPICRVAHIKDAIFHLQASAVKIVTATEKTDNLLYDIDFNQAMAIVIGSEYKGVSTSVQKLSDYKAKLPLLGEIKSLNVSVTCGAFLYEAIRQRFN